ncbi:MAG: ATP-binding protein, partial [Candidatus Marinamargulisbacteria bacterium]
MDLVAIVSDELNDATPPFIIACSGGPDSVFLTTMIAQAFPNQSHRLVYCNHHLRPEVENEIQTVHALGDRCGFPVHI